MTGFFKSAALLAVGIAAASVAFGRTRGSADNLGGAFPVGEDVLVATTGMIPNYLFLSRNEYCCLNSVEEGWVCDCGGQPDDTLCSECDGVSTLSGVYFNGHSSGIEPTGGDAPCDYLVLYEGTCSDGACNAIDTYTDCSGDYPTFINEPIGMDKRNGPSRGNEIAMLPGTR
jgi:hypothetical protein